MAELYTEFYRFPEFVYRPDPRVILVAVTLSLVAAGRMRRINLDVGDSVTADETTLVRMEPSSADLLDPRAVAQAQARVRAAERRLEQAEAELRRGFRRR